MAESATPRRSMASPMFAAGSLARRSSTSRSGRGKSASMSSRTGVVMMGVFRDGVGRKSVSFLYEGKDFFEVFFLACPEVPVVLAGQVAGLQPEVCHLLDHGGILDGLLDCSLELGCYGFRQPGRGGVAADGAGRQLVAGFFESGHIRKRRRALISHDAQYTCLALLREVRYVANVGDQDVHVLPEKRCGRL